MKNLDKKILLQLMENSGRSISEIAKRVGTTRQTVAKKVKQLLASGVISSFSVRLNPEKVGLRTKAYILLREDSKDDLRMANEKAVKKFYQVSKFHRLFGRYSGILEVWVRDSKELTNLIKKIHSLKGVRETETFIVHSTVKDKPEEPFARFLRFGGT